MGRGPRAIALSRRNAKNRYPHHVGTPFPVGPNKRQGAVKNALLVKQLIGFAVREHTPFPRRSILCGILGANAGRAIGRDGVMPLRFVPQCVERIDVFEEALARVRRRNGGVVKIDRPEEVSCRLFLALTARRINQRSGF